MTRLAAYVVLFLILALPKGIQGQVRLPRTDARAFTFVYDARNSNNVVPMYAFCRSTYKDEQYGMVLGYSNPKVPLFTFPQGSPRYVSVEMETQPYSTGIHSFEGQITDSGVLSFGRDSPVVMDNFFLSPTPAENIRVKLFTYEGGCQEKELLFYSVGVKREVCKFSQVCGYDNLAQRTCDPNSFSTGQVDSDSALELLRRLIDILLEYYQELESRP